MFVKSRTSTQHAYMKLLLIAAILICTNGVVASATFEPVEHRRLVGFLRRSSFDKESFLNKWTEAFRRQERKRISAEKKKNAVSDDHEVQAKIITAYNGGLSLIQEAVEVAKVLKSNNLFDVVKIKIIYRGKLDERPEVRLLAEEVESQLLRQWEADGKSLDLQFKELKLNEMKTEMELYANPAFTTWMNFAFHLIRADPNGRASHIPDERERIVAFRLMLAVLQRDMQKSSTRKSLQNVHVDSEEEGKLFEKWSLVFDHQSTWHDVINNA